MSEIDIQKLPSNQEAQKTAKEEEEKKIEEAADGEEPFKLDSEEIGKLIKPWLSNDEYLVTTPYVNLEWL